MIDDILDDLAIDARIASVQTGPTTTTYALELGPKTHVGAIEKASRTIAVRLGHEEVRILSPIPGTTHVGIEVPLLDHERRTVRWDGFEVPGPPLSIPIGMDGNRAYVSLHLPSAPHLLIAGTTGSGKSVALNAILSTLVAHDLDRVRLTLVDPKQVELTPYEDVATVVTETEAAASEIADLVALMEQRYAAMRDAGVRHADDLDMRYHVLVVDELADLLMSRGGKAIEDDLVRLAQKGRAARIHLILATQRPTVQVVTGLLKANIPTRLAFATTSTTDSMVILDQPGASALVGRGDALYLGPGQRRPVRVQAPLITDAEVDEVVDRAAAKRRARAGEMAKPKREPVFGNNFPSTLPGRHRLSDDEIELQSYQAGGPVR